MYEALLFLNEGFEEVEAVTVLDVLRRGGCITASVSLTGAAYVTGSHNITVKADMAFASMIQSVTETQGITFVLPGGPGTANYKTNRPFLELLSRHHKLGGRIAAICAAPSILGMLGILDGVEAVCYPGFEQELSGAKLGTNAVVADKQIITSKGPATALEFSLEVLKEIKGAEISGQIAKQMLYKGASK